MITEHVAKFKEVCDKIAPEHKTAIGVLSEASYRVTTESESTKSIWLPDSILTVYQSTNYADAKHGCSVGLLDFDTIKQIYISVDIEGLRTIITEYGGDPDAEDWKAFIQSAGLFARHNATNWNRDKEYTITQYANEEERKAAEAARQAKVNKENLYTISPTAED